MVSEFQFMVLGCIDSGPRVRQNIMAVGACGGGYSPHDKQEVQRGEGARGKIQPSKTHPQ
jgi:hypothetical protein